MFEATSFLLRILVGTGDVELRGGNDPYVRAACILKRGQAISKEVTVILSVVPAACHAPDTVLSHNVH